MNNRFVNGRKLKCKYFYVLTALVDYVNKKQIESDDIQLITQTNGSNWALLYWD